MIVKLALRYTFKAHRTKFVHFLQAEVRPLLYDSLTPRHDMSGRAVFLITHRHDARSSHSHAVMTRCLLTHTPSRRTVLYSHAIMTGRPLQGDRPSSSDCQPIGPQCSPHKYIN